MADRDREPGAKKKGKTPGEAVENGLKETVLDAVQAVVRAGEVARTVAETAEMLVPKTGQTGGIARNAVVRGAVGAVGAAAGTVRAAGQVASCVTEVIEGNNLADALRGGQVRAGILGARAVEIALQVQRSGQTVLLLGDDNRPLAAVVPWTEEMTARNAPAPGGEAQAPTPSPTQEKRRGNQGLEIPPGEAAGSVADAPAPAPAAPAEELPECPDETPAGTDQPLKDRKKDKKARAEKDKGKKGKKDGKSDKKKKKKKH